MNKKITGLLCLALGAAGCVCSFWTIWSDLNDALDFLLKGYDYQPPFNSHELAILALLTVGIVLLVVGICLLLLLLPGQDEQGAENAAGGMDGAEIIEKIDAAKKLLDNHTITQEEYNRLKTELLQLQ